MQTEVFSVVGASSKGARGLIAMASILGVSSGSLIAAVTNFTDGVTVGTGNTVDAWSLAVGSDNAAERKSLAVGHDVILSGFRSFGAGQSLTLDGDSGNSVIFGKGSSLIQSYTMLVSGQTNVVTRQSAGLIVGNQNSAWAPASPTIGNGDSNVILGDGNHINPDHLTAPLETTGILLMGIDNKTQESQSWVLGMGNIGQTNTVTLGTYNQTVNDASLIVGTGVYDEVNEEVNRANGLVVLRSGTVQIPSGVLQLGGENALTSTSATSLISSHLSTNGYLKNAYGTYANVSNGGLLALGWASEATANAAFAIGDNSHATGARSMAVGANTMATGWRSTALGDSSRADGDSSFAIGGRTYAAGRESLAIGSMASSNAIASLAIGYMSTVAGNATGASAIGRSAYAAGENSTSLGWCTSTVSVGSTALGANNLGHFVNGNSPWLWMETDSVLEVGNGINETQRSNAITTLKNGRTTLTNKHWDSEARTEVPANAAEASSGQALVVEGHTVLEGNTELKGKVTLSQPQGDLSMGVYQ